MLYHTNNNTATAMTYQAERVAHYRTLDLGALQKAANGRLDAPAVFTMDREEIGRRLAKLDAVAPEDK